MLLLPVYSGFTLRSGIIVEAPFTFASPAWLLVLPLLFAALGWRMLRTLPAALLPGGVALLLGWMGYGLLLRTHMEQWLEARPVYAVLFKDYPQFKTQTIAAYLEAYHGGPPAMARQEEDMKLLIATHYVKHYVAQAPASAISAYVLAQAWLLAALDQKNPALCQRYLGYSGFYPEVQRAVGDALLQPTLQAAAELIVQAHDTPQPLSAADKQRAGQLNAWLRKNLQSQRINLQPDAQGILPCDTLYRELYVLTRWPAHDAALLLKYPYGDQGKQPNAGAPLAGFF